MYTLFVNTISSTAARQSISRTLAAVLNNPSASSINAWGRSSSCRKMNSIPGRKQYICSNVRPMPAACLTAWTFSTAGKAR